MKLMGRWAKVPGDPCGDRYPQEIEFAEATYLGTKGPGQGFVLWDAGIYRVVDEGRVLVQGAADELQEYRARTVDDLVEFEDEAGCVVRYRRATVAED